MSTCFKDVNWSTDDSDDSVDGRSDDEDTEDPDKQIVKKSALILKKLFSGNHDFGDKVDIRRPSSCVHLPSIITYFIVLLFDVKEAELCNNNSSSCASEGNTCGDREHVGKIKFMMKMLCSIFHPGKHKVIPIVEAFLKYLKSENAKENARKNIANGKSSTKHKSGFIKLLAPNRANEATLPENVSDRPNCYIVDVMNILRAITWTNRVRTFKDLAIAFCDYVRRHCVNVKRIDYVFDSYPKVSPKSANRLERYGHVVPTEFPIGDNKSLPSGKTRADQFWGCDKNKIKIQTYLRNFIRNNFADHWKNALVVLSETDEEQCQLCPSERSDSPPEDIYCQLLRRPDIAEADDKIMLHIQHATLNGYHNIAILSQDTDVFILASYYYWKAFKNNGLKELWMMLSGKLKKFRPLHDFAETHGRELCAVLPAVHNLTGADCTDKVGTKYGGLQADPVKYLSGFALGTSQDEMNIAVRCAEEYLVQVIRKGNTSKTFDELSDPQMTSAFIKQNILRAFFVTYNTFNILDATNYNSLDPQKFGYRLEANGLLMPIRPTVETTNGGALSHPEHNSSLTNGRDIDN